MSRQQFLSSSFKYMAPYDIVCDTYRWGTIRIVFHVICWLNKQPVFSFNKFPNVNKELGPEMKSTGEAIRFIDDLMDDYFLDIYAERNHFLSR